MPRGYSAAVNGQKLGLTQLQSPPGWHCQGFTCHGSMGSNTIPNSPPSPAGTLHLVVVDMCHPIEQETDAAVPTVKAEKAATDSSASISKACRCQRVRLAAVRPSRELKSILGGPSENQIAGFRTRVGATLTFEWPTTRMAVMCDFQPFTSRP